MRTCVDLTSLSKAGASMGLLLRLPERKVPGTSRTDHSPDQPCSSDRAGPPVGAANSRQKRNPEGEARASSTRQTPTWNPKPDHRPFPPETLGVKTSHHRHRLQTSISSVAVSPSRPPSRVAAPRSWKSLLRLVSITEVGLMPSHRRTVVSSAVATPAACLSRLVVTAAMLATGQLALLPASPRPGPAPTVLC